MVLSEIKTNLARSMLNGKTAVHFHFKPVQRSKSSKKEAAEMRLTLDLVNLKFAFQITKPSHFLSRRLQMVSSQISWADFHSGRV